MRLLEAHMDLFRMIGVVGVRGLIPVVRFGVTQSVHERIVNCAAT
jgi:hypothetical protein